MSKKTKLAREEKKKKATYNMTAEMLDAFQARLEQEAMSNAFVVMLGLSVLTINDKFSALEEETEDKRAECFTDHIFKLWESFNAGDITLQDCIDVLKDECGIDIVKDGINRCKK